MSIIMSNDESSEDSFSELSRFSVLNDFPDLDQTLPEKLRTVQRKKPQNLIISLGNRERYGRITKHPKAKTDKLFNNVYHKCKFSLSSLIPDYNILNHVFMGFTLCGGYFISFKEIVLESASFHNMFVTVCEYELYVWRFKPGRRLQFVSKHQIFRHRHNAIDKFMFIQFPKDPYKLVCYGLTSGSSSVVSVIYMTIFTLPFPKSCQHCHPQIGLGWCEKHGFMLHYMFSMAQPCPTFDPFISLAYPDHIVINTGHYIHILNIKSADPPKSAAPNLAPRSPPHDEKAAFNDNFSELSESEFGASSVVDAILEDFNEYDLEAGGAATDGSAKPFHELNISCEALNGTGKGYHSQNIVDPRIERLQAKDYAFSVPQSSLEKRKIDKKQAEKAYEFVEETEKCEKLSSFRKKRLAEKKYEFSDDNSENIVPFNSLRGERRFLYKSASRYASYRSPEFGGLFLSPRSPRPGQFSPSNIYCPLVGRSARSPISPREPARKFYAYSPSPGSDCSDSESRLVMRTHPPSGLLIVDPKTEAPKWLKKVVRRYSNGDFENGSLLSGQSRDDYNIPIEIPLVVHNLNEQHLDVVPDFQSGQLTEMQLIVSQRTFDCEQFVMGRAQKACTESELEYLYCQDYDIKMNYICPLEGDIVCQAVIKIGAMRSIEPYKKPANFTTHCLFIWNIESDSFQVIEQRTDGIKLQPSEKCENIPVEYPLSNKCDNGVHVMDYCLLKSKTTLRDYNNCYEIYFGTKTSEEGLRSYYSD